MRAATLDITPPVSGRLPSEKGQTDGAVREERQSDSYWTAGRHEICSVTF